jgi:hypothetical protein
MMTPANDTKKLQIFHSLYRKVVVTLSRRSRVLPAVRVFDLLTVFLSTSQSRYNVGEMAEKLVADGVARAGDVGLCQRQS